MLEILSSERHLGVPRAKQNVRSYRFIAVAICHVNDVKLAMT